MKQEFEMTQDEMDRIIEINHTTSSPVMMIGGVDFSNNLREAINAYWRELGNKYGFKPMTVEGSSRGKLFFLAEPTPPPPPPKTQTEIEMEKFDTLPKIIEQLESAYSGESKEQASDIGNNIAFMALKKMAHQ